MILLTLLIPLILGLFLLSTINYKQGRLAEKLALSFMLGLGILVIIMFILSLLNLSLNLIDLTIAVAILILLMAKARISPLPQGEGIIGVRAFQLKSLSLPKLDWLEWSLLLIIGLKLALTFFFALIKPMIDVDAFQFYSIVAKGLFYQKNYFAPYLTQFMFDKPPFPFLAQGWVLISANTMNDCLLKIIGPVLFLCLLVIFYSCLRKEISRTSALLFTFFLSTLPFMLYHATTAYADLYISCYFAVGGIYLYQAMKEKASSLNYLLIAAVCLAITVWTKRGGLVLSLVCFFVYLIFSLINKTNLKNSLLALLTFILLILPWLILGKAGLFIDLFRLTIGQIISSPAAISTAQEMGPLPNTAVIIAVFSKKLFLYADWHLTMALFIVSLVFFFRRAVSQPAVYLLAIIIFCLSSIFIQFGSIGMFRWLLDGTLLDRLVMNEIPLILYFCGIVIGPSLFNAQKKNACAQDS